MANCSVIAQSRVIVSDRDWVRDRENVDDRKFDVARKFSQYTILKKLGAGGSGKVYSAKDEDGNRVAIKCIDKCVLSCDDIARDRKLGVLPREVVILKQVSHENIVRVLDNFEDAQYYYVVMSSPENCCDLFEFVERNTYIPEVRIRKIFSQVVSAVAHLHANHLVHRDIKDENVIVDVNDKVYLIDFGAARGIPRRQADRFTEFRGTMIAMSPEAIRGDHQRGFEQDVWALGILLFTMTFNMPPFTEELIAQKVKDRTSLPDLDDCLMYETPELPEEVNLQDAFDRSDELIDMIRCLLTHDVEKRIKVNDILKHAWFKCEL
jgi:protein-serine/threonine kinase